MSYEDDGRTTPKPRRARRRSEHPVEPAHRTGRAYLVVLGPDPGQQNGIDVRVVAGAGRAYGRDVLVHQGIIAR
jgi:hypothetical protein